MKIIFSLISAIQSSFPMGGHPPMGGQLWVPVPEIPSFPEFTPCFEKQKAPGNALACQDQDPELYVPKKHRATDCVCVDPISGKELNSIACNEPCRGEPGNTCKEQRERDLEVLNGPYMIMDFSAAACQKTNSALWIVKEYTWWGNCYCLNQYTGRTIVDDIPCSTKCPAY